MTVYFATTAGGVWGAERSMFVLAKALSDAGTTVHLLHCSAAVAEEWQREVEQPATRVQFEFSSRRATAEAYWRTFARLTDRTDLLVLFSYTLAVGALRPRRWPRGRPQVCLDLHDMVTALRGRAILNLCVTRIDTVIAVSKFTADQIFAPLRHKTANLTRPVDPIHFSPPPLGKPPVVGVVGRLTPEKVPLFLIDAVASISDVQLCIRGDDDSGYPGHRNTVTAYGKEVMGARIWSEPARPWASALDGIDVLVVANAQEPMGRTVLEAQLRGVLAVVPDSGGSAELVAHGVTGFHYSAGDPISLRNAITASRGVETASIIRSSRAAAESSTDPARYAARYVEAAYGA